MLDRFHGGGRAYNVPGRRSGDAGPEEYYADPYADPPQNELLEPTEPVAQPALRVGTLPASSEFKIGPAGLGQRHGTDTQGPTSPPELV